ncbi:unnamed protein product [Sphagnum balticum]
MFGGNAIPSRKPIFSSTPYYEHQHNSFSSNFNGGGSMILSSYRPEPVISSATLYNPTRGSYQLPVVPGFPDPEKLVRSVVASTYSHLGVQLPASYVNPSSQAESRGGGRLYGDLKPKPLFDDSDDEYSNPQLKPKIIVIRQDSQLNHKAY